MLNRLSVGHKLELLVLAPGLAFLLLLGQYAWQKYHFLESLRDIKSRYELFGNIQEINRHAQHLRMFVLSADDESWSANIKELNRLREQIALLNKKNLSAFNQENMTGLLDAFALIAETPRDELDEEEWQVFITETVDSTWLAMAKHSLDANLPNLLENNERYLLLIQLIEFVSREMSYLTFLQQNPDLLDPLTLQQHIYQQQQTVDECLSRFATEKDIENLLNAFDHESFHQVKDIRSRLLYGGELDVEQVLAILTDQALLVGQQRQARVEAVAADVQKRVIIDLSDEINDARLAIVLDAVLLLLVCVLVVYLFLLIRKRIVGSLSFIGSALETIEYEKDSSICLCHVKSL